MNLLRINYTEVTRKTAKGFTFKKLITTTFGYCLEVHLGQGNGGNTVHYSIDVKNGYIDYDPLFAKLKPNESGFMVLFID